MFFLKERKIKDGRRFAALVICAVHSSVCESFKREMVASVRPSYTK